MNDPQEAERFVNENKSVGALITKEKSILITCKDAIKDLVEFYTHLSHIEFLFLMHFDMRIKFSSQIEIEGKDIIGVLVPPTLNREDVLMATRGKVLFPLKSTKHIPRIRPLSVNFPISFLQDEKIEEKNRELKTFLHQKKTQLFSGGMEVNGREYEEAVLIYKETD